jgi:hypothetical protein
MIRKIRLRCAAPAATSAQAFCLPFVYLLV